MTLTNLDNSKEVLEWLQSIKSKQTKTQYKSKWEIFLDYCKSKNLASNGHDILEDMKERRLSKDQTVKFFWDNETPKYFNWLRIQYKGKRGKPLSEGSALAFTTCVRSFFAFHRYALDIKKDALPSSEKVKTKFEDHAFDIYQLREMFKRGDLAERTILALGKDLWFRASDFLALQRDEIKYYIESEKTLAEQETREADIIEFEVITQKEKEPAICHLSKESIAILEDYFKTYPQKNGALFTIGAEALTDVLRRLAEKANISLKPNSRIRWHCLRKFGITVMHGKIREPVMKLMTGKHISQALKTYIQQNNETRKAFKQIEPLISLTKSNGNNNGALAKQLEEMKKEAFKRLAFQKFLEKTLPKETIEKAIIELAQEFGLNLKAKTVKIGDTGETHITYHIPELNSFIEELGETLEKKDLERVIKENGNGNGDSD